jgi:uncharacterized protein YabN with tetrapyrrole methylase and pyrophosphatase domain
MWGVCLTAPAFTPIQEQEERDALPPADREYLRQELYGEDTPCMEETETEALLAEECDSSSRTLAAVHSKIEEMEDCQKKDYIYALERCPDVVEKETNVLMFLRCENYDISVSKASTVATVLEWI